MRLRYQIIKVKDLQRAKKFYMELLNMQPYKEEWDRMVVFKLENIKIGLYNPLVDNYTLEEKDFWTSVYPSFWTDNLKAEKERIEKFTKIITHKKVEGHEWIEFKDSEWNLLEVHKI